MTGMAEVEQMEEALRVAMLAGDVSALSSLIDDALIFTGPDGVVVGKAQDLAAHASGILTLSNLTLSDRRLHSIGEMVLVTTRADLAGSFAGTPIEGTFAYTRLWSRASGQWRIVVGHAARIG